MLWYSLPWVMTFCLNPFQDTVQFLPNTVFIIEYWFPFLWLIDFILFFSSNGSTSAGGGGGNGTEVEGVGGDSGAHIDEEEWDNIDPLVDNGEPGVKVRALYDYEAAEEDELDFKAGNSIKVLFVKSCGGPFFMKHEIWAGFGLSGSLDFDNFLHFI